MAKTKISEFSATPGNNTDIDGINIAEGCAPSGINDAIRELMAQLKDFQTGAAGDSFNGPVGTTTAAAGAFTTLSSTGNTTLGDASGDAITINGNANFANVNPTLTAGTANGVAYLNGSKVLTTGSALQFDGTNLLVGTTTATYNQANRTSFEVNGASTAIMALKAGGTGQAYWYYDGAGVDFYALNGSLRFGASGSEQMRLTSTGLGIGTSSPSQKLHVYAASGSIRSLTETGNTSSAAFTAKNSGESVDYGVDSTGGFIQVVGAKPLLFYTNATERMRLDASGNLGLGVTPNTWRSADKVMQAGTGIGQYGHFVSAGVGAVYGGGFYRDDSGFKYTTTNAPAGRFDYNYTASGGFTWNLSPTGTAGNAISFTQAMTLDASGNLLVGGTSVYAATLTSYATATRSGGLGIRNSAGTAAGGIYTGAAGSGGSSTDVYVEGAGLLGFITNGSERARIDSSGNLLVGTTSNDSGLTAARFYAKGDSTNVNAITALAGTGGNGISVRIDSSGAQNFIDFRYGTTRVGTVTTNGTTTSYNTSSDYRLKENIAPMAGALSVVAQLKPVTYTWKADGSDGEGFIAHELAEVCPQAVTGEKDAVDVEGNPVYQGIDTSFLAGLYAAAIQELKAELDSVKAELAALKGN